MHLLYNRAALLCLASLCCTISFCSHCALFKAWCHIDLLTCLLHAQVAKHHHHRNEEMAYNASGGDGGGDGGYGGGQGGQGGGGMMGGMMGGQGGGDQGYGQQ